ncbi:kinase-like domain-containing protein [Daldinia decipiens]|uniref:kinase-like domain-containing protein n=1 Tax=Daldinia decipiens TaxID=326647 RepID=UPI0020C3D32A|nr:kinase-like domain-containing protein [Daldinia decipiens]KAI1660301.1 kinase-like domain-containing protein [Daldinia decipiens]
MDSFEPRRRRRARRVPRDKFAALKAFFDSSNMFHYEGLLGNGGQGSIYKIKYVELNKPNPLSRRLVAKVADPSRGSDVEGVAREKMILETLRYCQHIVSMIDSPDDPLASAQRLGWAWIFLEEMENGTLNAFLKRARVAGFVSLPNRMLWRIFLCMIRACIDMAWPPSSSDSDEKTIQFLDKPTGLVHNDIHGGNFMFGSLADDPEHAISPILKLLDFGLAQRINSSDFASVATGEQQNIEDIGIMMATILTLQTDWKYTGEDVQVDLSRLGYSSAVLSPASGILGGPEHDEPDPLPYIDRDMRLIIAACMASNPQDRPMMVDLERWVYSEVSNTQPAYYGINRGGAEWESNETICNIVQQCIFDALEDVT